MITNTLLSIILVFLLFSGCAATKVKTENTEPLPQAKDTKPAEIVQTGTEVTKPAVTEKKEGIEGQGAKSAEKAQAIVEDTRLADLTKGIEGINAQIERINKEIEALIGRTGRAEGNIDEISRLIKELKGLTDELGRKVSGLENRRIVKKLLLSDTESTFKFGSAVLTAKAKKKLDAFAEDLKSKTYHSIVIAGHTDSKGNEAYNLLLGRKRAEAVAAYLAGKQWIERNLLIVLTFGESVPIADNKNKSSRSRNRRVEITVYRNLLE